MKLARQIKEKLENGGELIYDGLSFKLYDADHHMSHVNMGAVRVLEKR